MGDIRFNWLAESSRGLLKSLVSPSPLSLFSVKWHVKFWLQRRSTCTRGEALSAFVYKHFELTVFTFTELLSENPCIVLQGSLNRYRNSSSEIG